MKAQPRSKVHMEKPFLKLGQAVGHPTVCEDELSLTESVSLCPSEPEGACAPCVSAAWPCYGGNVENLLCILAVVWWSPWLPVSVNSHTTKYRA